MFLRWNHALIKADVLVCWSRHNLGENAILIPTFWGHCQFSTYILVAVNLIPIIFNLQSI